MVGGAWLSIFCPSYQTDVKLTSSEKECHSRAEANVQILIKDYQDKQFFSGLTCMD